MTPAADTPSDPEPAPTPGDRPLRNSNGSNATGGSGRSNGSGGPGGGPGLAPVAYGIDIGGTKVLGVAIGPGDEVLTDARVATPHAAVDPDEPTRGELGGGVADAVAQVVASLNREVAKVAPPRVTVGVGAPGMLDRRGVLRCAPNLKGAEGADLATMIAKRIPHADVVVENDANCAALAEYRRGAAAGGERVLLVTLGTGIGGALVVTGRVDLGAAGFAGEVGHMVIDPNGPPCPCGRSGCWERYASGGGLARLAREAAYAGRLHAVTTLAGGDPELVRGEHVTRAARRGEPDALAVLEELGWWVAVGLANLVAVVDPDLVVLGGGLAEEADMLIGPTNEAFATLVEGSAARPPIHVVAAKLGERAGAIGAAMAGRDGGLG